MNRFRLPFRIIAILVVTIVAWGLRARAVSMLPIDFDEDDYLRAGQEFAHLIRTSNWRGFLETNYRPEHPPLAKIVFGLGILSAPEEPLTPDASTTAQPNEFLPRDLVQPARTISVVFGTLTVLALSLVNPLAGLFLAVHTFTIKYTSQIMLEALPAFLSLLSVLFYIQAKKNGFIKNKNLFNRWIIASAILLGLTAASKYLYCVMGIAILVDWFIESKQNNQLIKFYKQAALWGILSLIIFFAADPYLWPAPFTRLKDSVFYFSSYAATAPEVQQANFPPWQPFVWLMESVPWHPGVFLISIDFLITILAFIGLARLWRKERVYILWLGIAIFFLLLWPTKWPQYILILTAPLSLAAAEGFQAAVADPLKAWWAARGSQKRIVEEHRYEQRDGLRAIPWLIPGVITLILLAIFPLLFQFAMALTDYNGVSIRDGINGGVWREVWLGLTGQTKPIDFNAFSFTFHGSTQVHFVGFQTLLSLISGAGNGILIFSIIWTVLTVFTQATLGIAVALMLHRRGVRFVAFWRTIFILPWVIPEFIGALIWLRTFQPQVGWIGMLLPEGVIYRQTFDNAGYAFIVLLIAATWYGFPFLMLAATAGLKLVPNEVYESAALDGASSWNLFSNITWPLLLPLLIPAIIIRSIFAFNQFYLFYVMNPPNGMTTLATVSYAFFTRGNMYAASAAINIFTVVILIVILLWSNRWSKATEGVAYA